SCVARHSYIPLLSFTYNHTPPPYIYTLSLHDALPISFIIAAIQQIVDPRIVDRATHAIVENLRVRPLSLAEVELVQPLLALVTRDRKSTRLNSSHVSISYAVFCLKKKKKKH